MNSYKLKNSKQLSRFNSISQPQLSRCHNNNNNNNELNQTYQFINSVNWSERTSSLRQLLDENESSIVSESSESSSSLSNSNSIENKLPALVRVVSGSYGIIKESSDESALSKKYVNNLLLYNKSKSLFVLCQSIKFKDKKPFVYGKNISIPITYNGWFEMLSEDGKSIRPILSIKELANHAQSANNFKKMFNKPKNNISYIVREGVNAYFVPLSTISSSNSKSEATEKLVSNLRLVDCKMSQIKPGDILQIVGQIHMNQSSSNSFSYSLKSSISKRIKMYKCLVKRKPISKLNEDKIEMQTETLFIVEDALGKYSPVARIENISGVHKLADLVKKFRFPVTVQLVYGRAPATHNSGSLNSKTTNSTNPMTNNFSPILRLLKVYEEENVLAYPIGRDSCLIQIPTRINLILRKARNLNNLLDNSNYLKLILDECKILSPEYSDMIHNLPETPPELASDSNHLNTGIIQSCVKNLIGRTSLFDKSGTNFKNNTPSSSSRKLQDQFLNLSIEGDNQSRPDERSYEDELPGHHEISIEDDDIIYKEVDDLYEYVRTGVLPYYLDNQIKDNIVKQTSSSVDILQEKIQISSRKNPSTSSMNKKRIEIQSKCDRNSETIEKQKTKTSQMHEASYIKKLSHRQPKNPNFNNNQYYQHNHQRIEHLFDPSYFMKNNKRVNFNDVPPPPYSSRAHHHNHYHNHHHNHHQRYKEAFESSTTLNSTTQSPLNSRKLTSTSLEYNKNNSFQRIAVGGVPIYHNNDNYLIEPDEDVIERKENDWYESIQRFNSFDVKGFDDTISEQVVIANYNKPKPTKEDQSLRTFFSMEKLSGAYLTEDIGNRASISYSQRQRKPKYVNKNSKNNLI